MDKKKIGSFEDKPNSAQIILGKSFSDLYIGSHHDNERSVRSHRKHDALHFPVFAKRLPEQPKDSKSAFSPLPRVYDRHGPGRDQIGVKTNKLHESALNPNLDDCDENMLCNICSRFVKQTLCLKVFLRSSLSNDFILMHGFQQRKLLQEQRDQINIDDTASEHKEPEETGFGQSKVTLTEVTVFETEKAESKLKEKKRIEQLSQLIEELRRDVSKEPVWAMISVSVLMLVLALASKACGLRTIDRGRQIDIDIEQDFHNVSVMEVLRVKRRYLPKSFHRFKRKLRRKFRRKPKTIKEKDISEPLSDSSEEERLLYDRTNDV